MERPPAPMSHGSHIPVENRVTTRFSDENFEGDKGATANIERIIISESLLRLRALDSDVSVVTTFSDVIRNITPDGQIVAVMNFRVAVASKYPAFGQKQHSLLTKWTRPAQTRMEALKLLNFDMMEAMKDLGERTERAPCGLL
ncbi:MAG: hypothetical protein M1820_006251 [Bogoriella megaspora]|nr:MAG: hypothetical protein M1820_006251 [Bogoriella megaspora]